MARELTDLQRKYRDIFDYVTERLNEKIDGVQKYRHAAVMKMAQKKFYLSPDTIADIVRDYEPPPADPEQLGIDFPSDQSKPTP